MAIDLQGRTAIVTGASRGIGAAIAEELGRHGASVVVNYHGSREKAEAVASLINESGGKGMAFQADVRDSVAVNAMAEATIKQYGKIDILVNNANINFPIKPFVALS